MAPSWWRRSEPIPASAQTNAIVAAATRLRPRTDGRQVTIPVSSWQNEAWRFYDLNGELRFGCSWLSSALSRCRLVAVEIDDDGVPQLESPVPPAVRDLVDGLLGTQQAQLLAAMGVHLTVPGDCYVVGEVGDGDQFSNWYVLSTEEIVGSMGSTVTVDRGDGLRYTLDLNKSLVIRVYRQHPRRGYLADSPTRAALPVLREIEALSKHIFATIDSRLAGAGILVLPSEITFPTPRDTLEPGEDPFMATLTEAMVTPIQDRDNASAVVPITIRAPKEALQGIQWLVSPNTELTSQVADLRDKAIQRLALDLDLPAEVLLGSQAPNRWNQWNVEEQGIKLHIEPVMVLICTALTQGYLKPALAAAKLPPNYALWFDSSDLVLRPNRVQDAKDLFDRGELSGDALRRETGFEETDALAGDEAARFQALQLLKTVPQVTNQLLGALLPVFGLDAVGITPEMLAPDVPINGTPPQPPTVDPASDPSHTPPSPDGPAPANPKAPKPSSPPKPGAP